MNPKPPKLLILGIDGADPVLVEHFMKKGAMPTFAKLVSRGAFGPLQSTLPPTTLPAWTSFMTGTEPSTHGVSDFTIKDGYKVRFVGGKDRMVPTWFEHLENHGLKVGTAWFPATYPPLPLDGYQISGWDSPVTSFGDASFVHPQSLHQELASVFPKQHLSFDSINEFEDSSNWYEKSAAALPARVKGRADMAVWLLRNRPVDVAAFYFGETDTAAHHFWPFHDAKSPRRPSGEITPTLKSAIEDVYRAVDNAIERLMDEVGENTNIIILSDHGSGGTSDVVLYINRFLEENGFLTFKKTPLSSFNPSAGSIRGKAVSLIPKRLRRTLFNLAGGLAPTLLESRLRFGAIDWSRTIAFSEEVNYSPSIWFNQLGREPNGKLHQREREQLTKDISSALEKLTTPDGARLISRVIPREQLHKGKRVNLFPDLVIKLNNIDEYTPACLPSGGKSGPTVAKLKTNDLLGRKGRSLPGCHTDNGILLVAGPTIKKSEIKTASLQDVAGVICKITDTPNASWFEISPIKGLPYWGESDQLPISQSTIPITPQQSYTRAEEKIVADRLKRLGYLE